MQKRDPFQELAKYKYGGITWTWNIRKEDRLMDRMGAGTGLKYSLSPL